MSNLPVYLQNRANLHRLEKAKQKTATQATGRTNFTDFKRAIYKRYLHAPHLQKIDEALTAVERYVATGGKEGIGHLIIEMPPRHGKTVTTSRLFPAWVLGEHPDWRMMLVSYAADLAEKNSRAARNLIRSKSYQELYPNTKLASDSAAVHAWDIAEREGGVDAIGIGGGAAGKGAHILVIDDVVKDRAQAESQVYRDKIWDSYTDDLYTRLEPGGAVVVMMTRWHADDLIGRLLKREPEKWTRLRLPAIAEANDGLNRQPGEALWKERFPIEILLRLASTLGEYSFASLYQQNPLPAGTGLFKREKFKVVSPLAVPPLVKTVRFYDLAVTKKKTSDYTVGVKMGKTKDEYYYILHIWREQTTPTVVHKAIVQNAQIDGADVLIRLEAEKAGIVSLDYLLEDPDMARYTIDAVPPEGDKYTRSLPFAARVDAERVFIVDGTWNEPFLDEVCAFPKGAKDDQVDGCSGAYDMLAEEDGELSQQTIDYINNYRGG